MSGSIPWKERFKIARMRLDLDQDEMGRRLGRSREWVSKLENGHEEPSELMQIKLIAIEAELEGRKSESSFTVVKESQGYYGTTDKDRAGRKPAAEIRAKITKHVDELLLAAGDDVQRLGWIAEQLVHHVSEPVHWGMHERINQQVLAEERLKEQEEKARIKGQKTQGTK